MSILPNLERSFSTGRKEERIERASLCASALCVAGMILAFISVRGHGSPSLAHAGIGLISSAGVIFIALGILSQRDSQSGK